MNEEHLSYNQLETGLLLAEQRINIAVAIALSVDGTTRVEDVAPIHIINAIVAALKA